MAIRDMDDIFYATERREGFTDFRERGEQFEQGLEAMLHKYREGEILTRYLSVPKGVDIRMVYNGVSSGLNNAMWDPHFALPTVRHTLMETEDGTYMADRDIGEMFLNFMLSKDVRHYCRVNISNVRT